MSEKITLGSAESRPGTLQYGRWHAFTHATGQEEFLPVIIATGHHDGPCIWLTAGIHGTEHSGPWVLYELLTQPLVDRLRGTIVALPMLCPPGLRIHRYVPYVVDKNPNRLWPDANPATRQGDPEEPPPSALEEAYGRLYGEMRQSADYLIDYHNAWTDSISFVFRDRVLYAGEDERESAENLSARLDALLAAWGHTVVREFPAEWYLKRELHRSTSGVALLGARIPAFTAELGTGHMPDPAITRAALAGTRNVLRHIGMLDDAPEPITGIKRVDAGFPVRRTNALRAPCACVALHLVQAGESVQEGQPVAELRDAWGRLLPESPLRASADGFVMGRGLGILYNQGDTVLFLAVRDDDPLVLPWPG